MMEHVWDILKGLGVNVGAALLLFSVKWFRYRVFSIVSMHNADCVAMREELLKRQRKGKLSRRMRLRLESLEQHLVREGLLALDETDSFQYYERPMYERYKSIRKKQH